MFPFEKIKSLHGKDEDLYKTVCELNIIENAQSRKIQECRRGEKEHRCSDVIKQADKLG